MDWTVLSLIYLYPEARSYSPQFSPFSTKQERCWEPGTYKAGPERCKAFWDICVKQARLHLYEYKAAGGSEKGCFIMVWRLTQTGTAAGISVEFGFLVCSWSMAPVCSFSSQFQLSFWDQVKESLVQSPMTELAFVIRCALCSHRRQCSPMSSEFALREEKKRQMTNCINYKEQCKLFLVKRAWSVAQAPTWNTLVVFQESSYQG